MCLPDKFPQLVHDLRMPGSKVRSFQRICLNIKQFHHSVTILHILHKTFPIAGEENYPSDRTFMVSSRIAERESVYDLKNILK